jgi:hypothetical protein
MSAVQADSKTDVSCMTLSNRQYLCSDTRHSSGCYGADVLWYGYMALNVALQNDVEAMKITNWKIS